MKTSIETGADWRTLPKQLSAGQAAGWLGLTRGQWARARNRNEVREAQVFGTGGKGLRFWTVRLRALVPDAAAVA